MKQNEQITTECVNLIIRNQTPQAAIDFTQAYRNHPDHWPFFCGLICCRLLCGESEELLSLLTREQEISPHRDVIRGLLGFFRRQPALSTEPAHRSLYNTALFLRKSYPGLDVSLLLTTGEIIRPGDTDNLTILGEQAVLRGDYLRGVQYYTQAARLSYNT